MPLLLVLQAVTQHPPDAEPADPISHLHTATALASAPPHWHVSDAIIWNLTNI